MVCSQPFTFELFLFFLAAFQCLLWPVHASPIDRQINISSPYAPVRTTCPGTSLIRQATSLSDGESKYISRRRRKASQALSVWLKRTNAGFATSNLPTIALTTSGGGYRSFLTGAGVIQALDGRDSQLSTSGLLQSITYHSTLSGGSWLLSSLAGNNFCKVSYIQQKLWRTTLPNGFLPTFSSASAIFKELRNDINSKTDAGFPSSVTDPWGRLLSYSLLFPPNSTTDERLSAITASPAFLSEDAPYPIISAIGVKQAQGQCKPESNSVKYEFHPFEFGSWDRGVSAFTPTRYLGTNITNGQPTIPGQCIENFDNLGLVMGSSSNLANFGCPTRIEAGIPAPGNPFAPMLTQLQAFLDSTHQRATEGLYAMYPNPWNASSGSPRVQNDSKIYLVDGGEAMQNNPVWPLLSPFRPVDVILVNDNSADTSLNFPNGTALHETFEQAMRVGLSRMPYIPHADEFVAKGFDRRAAFFGCDDKTKITIVWWPNANFTFASGQSTAKMMYSTTEMDGMIENGRNVATQGGNGTWATCLGCAFVLKTNAKMPKECNACLDEYCYR